MDLPLPLCRLEGSAMSGFWDRIGLELRRPNRQTVVGFVLAWVCVIVIVLLTMWLARIGT